MSWLSDIWSVQIENTAYCNRKCPWCPQSKLTFYRDQTMQWPTLERIVLELKKHNYRGRLHPYGNGEPLTDSEFIDRVRFIRRELPDCLIYISTNGDFIGKPHGFEDILRAGVNEIQCNHYDDKNQHLRAFQQNVEHYNLGDLRTNFYNRAGNIKIASITPSAHCWFPGKKLYFNYWGDMLVCCADWTFEYPIGNINEQSLEELCQSPVLQEYRVKLAQGRARELPLCSQCNLIRHQEAL